MAKDTQNLDGLSDLDLTELKDSISENLYSRIEELQQNVQHFEEQVAQASDENKEHFQQQLEGIRQQRDQLVEELRARELTDESGIGEMIDNIMDQIREFFENLTGGGSSQNR